MHGQLSVWRGSRTENNRMHRHVVEIIRCCECREKRCRVLQGAQVGPAGSELGPGRRGPGEEPKQADMQTGKALVPSLTLELDLWGSVGPQAPEDLPFQMGYSLFLSRDLGEEVLLGSLPSFPRGQLVFC